MIKKIRAILTGTLTILITLTTNVSLVLARAGSGGGGIGGSSSGGHYTGNHGLSWPAVFYGVIVGILFLFADVKIEKYVDKAVKREKRAFLRGKQLPWQNLENAERKHYFHFYQQLQANYDRCEYCLANHKWFPHSVIFLYWQLFTRRSLAQSLTSEIYTEARKNHCYSKTTITGIDALKKIDLPNGKRLILYQFTGKDQTINLQHKVIAERQKWTDIYVFSAHNKLLRILYNGGGINDLLIDERVNSKNKLISFWRTHSDLAIIILIAIIVFLLFICHTVIQTISSDLV